MMKRGGGKNSSAFYTILAFINLPSWPMRLYGQKNYINNRRFCIPHNVPQKMKEIVVQFFKRKKSCLFEFLPLLFENNYQKKVWLFFTLKDTVWCNDLDC